MECSNLKVLEVERLDVKSKVALRECRKESCALGGNEKASSGLA